MHRIQLLALLKDFVPYDHKEQIDKQCMISFVEQHVDCFERSLLVGHITGSAWVVSPDNSKALLTHHKKLNTWLQLGGHCDGNSNVLQVALREVQEESGIEHINPLSESIFDIDIHPIPARGNEPEHYHYDVRFIIQANTEAYIVSPESHDLAWISRDEELFFVQRYPVLARMFKKWSTFIIPGD